MNYRGPKKYALIAAAILVAAHGAGATEEPKASPGGKLGTLPIGRYACSLPGRADIAAFIPEPSRDFKITYGSTYESSAGKGTYLLTGKQLLFTSGPLNGMRYVRMGNNTLRALGPDGKASDLLCTRATK